MGENKIKALPKDIRPRERLLKYGTSSVSDSELLAIILRVGTKDKNVIQLADELLNKFGGLDGLLKCTVTQLSTISGIKNDKAATLMAAFELAKRVRYSKDLNNLDAILNPEDVKNALRSYYTGKMKEEFLILCLNTRNKIVAYESISVGTVNASLVEPREVYAAAIKHSAKSIIAVHNHPSGHQEASYEDWNLTKRLVEAGKLLRIPLDDHIIVADDNCVSLRETTEWDRLT